MMTVHRYLQHFLSFFLILPFPLEGQTACFSTHAQLLLSLPLFLFLSFSPRRTRRKGRKGLGEFQESSGRLTAVSTNDAISSSWGRVFWGSSRQHTKRCLSGLRGWPSQHSSVPCYSSPSALQSYQQAVWLCCGCRPSAPARQLVQEKSDQRKTSLKGFEIGLVPALPFHKALLFSNTALGVSSWL